MYDIRQDIRHIQVAQEQIVAIIESINQPMVAASGRSAEQAKAFILGVRRKSGMFSIYVYLYLVASKDCLVYLHDPEEIAMDAYHDMELDALGFVESMGFMVDNMNFRNMSAELQRETMDGLPMFHADLETFARKQNPPEEAELAEIDDDPADGEIIADLSPLEEDILELEEVAEEVCPPPVPVKVVSEEGLAKVIRMFSSF